MRFWEKGGNFFFYIFHFDWCHLIILSCMEPLNNETTCKLIETVAVTEVSNMGERITGKIHYRSNNLTFK